jgi:two-component system, chemotaxis family, chemotaxis protein CheY
MNFLFQTVLAGKYKVLPVADVYQAMSELKRREDIRLILIDLDYHTQEAWEFIQHIQTSVLYKDMPIVVLASKNDRRHEGLDLSKVYNLFYKPFSPVDIVNRIDELVMAEIYKN